MEGVPSIAALPNGVCSRSECGLFPSLWRCVSFRSHLLSQVHWEQKQLEVESGNGDFVETKKYWPLPKSCGSHRSGRSARRAGPRDSRFVHVVAHVLVSCFSCPMTCHKSTGRATLLMRWTACSGNDDVACNGFPKLFNVARVLMMSTLVSCVPRTCVTLFSQVRLVYLIFAVPKTPDMTRLSEYIMRVSDVLCLSAVTIRGLVYEWFETEGLNVRPGEWWVRRLLHGMRSPPGA